MKYWLNFKHKQIGLSRNLKKLILWGVLLNLAACTENVREATSLEIAQQIDWKAAADNTQTWTAPELQVRHFRLMFYGYDTVYYRLKALKSTGASDNTRYFLLIDANYGANPQLKQRNYSLAKLVDGTLLQMSNLDHDTGRCQYFSTMNFACLYRDRGEIELSRGMLEAGRHVGLELALGSADASYEHVDLPAAYVDGFIVKVAGK
jgi:hypothetical protein